MFNVFLGNTPLVWLRMYTYAMYNTLILYTIKIRETNVGTYTVTYECNLVKNTCKYVEFN